MHTTTRKVRATDKNKPHPYLHVKTWAGGGSSKRMSYRNAALVDSHWFNSGPDACAGVRCVDSAVGILSLSLLPLTGVAAEGGGGYGLWEQLLSSA
jgi:hypothetical protein